MFVLDTNTVIYFFKGKGRVAEHLLATSPREIALPAVVVYELEVGTLKMEAATKRRKQLDQLVTATTVLPFGVEEARIGAQIRLSLERAGMKIGPLDNLIAATAMRHSAILVTHNVDEFSRVEGLTISDWFV
ncbi:MAG: type II toxin-antitoxin system VapC family toxin [Acidobacteriota bacterium]